MQEENLQCIKEDEVDLRELFATIWANKFTIMTISMLVTSLAILYVLYKPNLYISKSILIPKDQGGKPSISGGAATIAAMAGINIGGGGGLDIANLFKNLLSDYAFNKPLIERYHLDTYLAPENIEKHLVFAANQRTVYDFFNNLINKDKTKEVKSYDEVIFNTFEKRLKRILSVSTDKDSGAITLTAKFEDRFMAKKLVDIYLREMSEYIKRLDLKEIDEQVAYYEEELRRAKNLDLKANINELLSALVKKKVLSQAGEFYMVKQLTKPEVPYIKDKAGPKRALIVLVAFITSTILGIFYIFFREFMKSNKEEEEIDETYKYINE
jgi:LPS O-antigen subunit length determinant protein (WzzB/FepE family)